MARVHATRAGLGGIARLRSLTLSSISTAHIIAPSTALVRFSGTVRLGRTMAHAFAMPAGRGLTARWIGEAASAQGIARRMALV